MRRAGLPNYGAHGLRHNCATLLLQDGENIKVVSERLGHSTVVLTLATYVHVLPGMQGAATRRLGSLHPEATPDAGGPIGHRQATEERRAV